MAETEELGLEVFVEGWRQFENIMSRLDKSIDGLEKEMESTTKTSGAFSVAIGTLAANAVAKLAEVFVDLGRKVVDFTIDSVKLAADFQDSMAVLSVAASSTGLTFDELKEAALAVGGDTRLLGVSATGAAASMTGLFKAGLTTTEIFGDLNAFMEEGAELGGALKASIDLAAATELDMVAASDLAAVALASFGGEMKTEAERAEFINFALDNMVKAADASVAEVGDLSIALKNVGPTASALGIPIEDVNTALAILSTRGITGSEAGNALKSMLIGINRPVDAVKDKLNALGVSLFDTEGNFKGLPTVIDDLSKSMFGVNQVTVEVGGRTEEQNKMLEEAEKRYKSLTRRISNHNAGLNVMTDKGLAKANAELAASSGIIENLSAVQGTLVTKTVQLTEAQRFEAAQVLASSFGSNALLTLLGEQVTLTEDGANGWDAMNAAIDDAAGIQTQAAARSQTFNAQMEAMDGVIETVKIRIGDTLLPVATELAKWFSAMVEEHGPALTAIFETVAEVISGVVAVIQDALSGVLGVDYPWEDVFPPEIADFMYSLTDIISNTLLPAFDTIIIKIQEFIEPITTWIEDNIELQDLLIGLGYVLLSIAVPAIIAITTALVTMLASVIAIAAPIIAIIVAAALLRKAWEEDFLGMRTTLTAFWEEKVKPAFEAIQEWLTVNIPLAIEAAATFWEETLKPALEAVWKFIVENLVIAFETVVKWLSENIPLAMQALETFWKETLLPAFEAIEKWLVENIPLAIETVKAFWEETLIPALEAVWEYIVENIIPIFLDVVDWLQTKIPEATTALALIWENTLKPALEIVWKFIVEDLLPLFESVRKFFAEALTLALEAISGIWENTLKPALETVWEFLRDSLMPMLNNLADFFKVTFILAMEKANPVLEGIKAIFDLISGAVGSVIGWIDDLTSKLQSITLPDWMTPGSPTPLELGLRGIASAMQEVSGLSDGLFAGMPSNISVSGRNGVSPSAAPGTQITNNVTNHNEGDNFNLSTNTNMQPGGVALEFGTMSMRSK